MKKVLLASTALVAFTGAAAAEITFAGFAEMGVLGGDGLETQFHNDWGLIVKMASETDSGLTFGASMEIQKKAGPTSIDGDANYDNEQVYISGAFGKLTLGEIDGAMDWAMKEVALGTAIADDHTTHVGYNGNGALDAFYDNQVLRYEYSFGDFGFAVSATQDDDLHTNSACATPCVNNVGDGATDDPILGVGFKYATEFTGAKVGFGVGLLSGENFESYGVSADVAMDMGFKGILNYSSADFDTPGADVDHYGVGLGYEVGAFLIAANYGEYDNEVGPDFDSYGLVANYDLGGGAILAAGYGSDVSTAPGDQDQFSVGLRLDF